MSVLRLNLISTSSPHFMCLYHNIADLSFHKYHQNIFLNIYVSAAIMN